MTPTKLSWYLSAVFAVSALVQSAMTVHPSAQAAANVFFACTAAVATLFGATAVVLWKLGSPKPRWLVRIFQTLAALGTLWLVAMLGG